MNSKDLDIHLKSFDSMEYNNLKSLTETYGFKDIKKLSQDKRIFLYL